MDFARLPPEISSGLMHSGPGAGSLTVAAAAWDRLAGCLRAAAADAPRTETTAPHIDWLTAGAERAAQAAVHAAAAAAAHDSALAAMVAPSTIDANRAKLRSLAAANHLGLDGPAIAAIEAGYERMWAQDAAAMYAYAAASAEAAAMTPFTPPPPFPADGAPRTWALRSAPEIESTGRDVMAAISQALQAFSSSPMASLEVSVGPVTPSLSRLSSLSAPSGVALSRLNALNKAAALRRLLPDPGGARTAAAFARAASIGAMSAPAAWATAAAPVPVRRGTVA